MFTFLYAEINFEVMDPLIVGKINVGTALAALKMVADTES